MTGTQWLDEAQRRITERAAEVECSRPDADTLTLANGIRGVVLHDTGEGILLSPSVAMGSTVADRLHHRVQYLEIQQYGMNEATVDVAVNAALQHLR